MKKLLLTLLLPLSISATPLPPKSGTVVLLHGFLESSLSMNPVKRSLVRENWDVVNWSYPSRDKTILNHSNDLVSKLNKIAKEKPGLPISFVTHSMGSLVVRGALNHPNCPKEAKLGRAVLLAPPSQGSSFGMYLSKFNIVKRFVGKWSGKELLESKANSFNYIGAFPRHMPVLIISGTGGWNPSISELSDGTVTVSETCLDTPHFHKYCKAQHTIICTSYNAVQYTKNFLKAKEIKQPTYKLCDDLQKTPKALSQKSK